MMLGMLVSAVAALLQPSCDGRKKKVTHRWRRATDRKRSCVAKFGGVRLVTRGSDRWSLGTCVGKRPPELRPRQIWKE
jgi:hypothetical protein